MAGEPQEHHPPDQREEPREEATDNLDAGEGEKEVAPGPIDGNRGEKEEGPPQPQGHPPPVTLAIWPPTQRAREAVTKSLVETLSAPSSLFKRYGTLPLEEASAVALRIELEAFSATSSHGAAAADAEGMEALNVYSKEISRRVLEFFKARTSASPPSPAPSTFLEIPVSPSDSTTAASEEASSLESENSVA